MAKQAPEFIRVAGKVYRKAGPPQFTQDKNELGKLEAELEEYTMIGAGDSPDAKAIKAKIQALQPKTASAAPELIRVAGKVYRRANDDAVAPADDEKKKAEAEKWLDTMQSALGTLSTLGSKDKFDALSAALSAFEQEVTASTGGKRSVAKAPKFIRVAGRLYQKIDA